MKKIFYLPIVFAFTFYSCSKSPVTKPVKFTATSYETLGSYTSTGMPDYLTAPDTISADLLAYIDTLLPNGVDLRPRHPELLNNPAIADITITQPSDVYITFVKEDGGFTNSIAFYTYPTNAPPTSATDIRLITYVFPNAGHFTPLTPGDKVKIGNFQPGTSIGFVLMQNAWNSTSHDLNNNAVHFCTNDALNPEVDPNLKKHAVLVNYAPANKVIVGFEDSDRTTSQCDNDFNDVLFYCTVTP